MTDKVYHGRVDEPKGDPGNTLSRPEIEKKAIALAAYRGGASADEMRKVIDQAWNFTRLERVGDLLP